MFLDDSTNDCLQIEPCAAPGARASVCSVASKPPRGSAALRKAPANCASLIRRSPPRSARFSASAANARRQHQPPVSLPQAALGDLYTSSAFARGHSLLRLGSLRDAHPDRDISVDICDRVVDFDYDEADIDEVDILISLQAPSAGAHTLAQPLIADGRRPLAIPSPIAMRGGLPLRRRMPESHSPNTRSRWSQRSQGSVPSAAPWLPQFVTCVAACAVPPRTSRLPRPHVGFTVTAAASARHTGAPYTSG